MRGNFSLHGAKTIRSSTIHSGLSNPHLTVLEHNYTLDDIPSRVKQTVFHSGFPFEVRENLFLGESCKEPHLKIKVLCYQHLRKSSRITDEWNGHWEFSEIGGKYSAVGRGGCRSSLPRARDANALSWSAALGVENRRCWMFSPVGGLCSPRRPTVNF